MIVLSSSDQELYSPLYEYYDGKKMPHAEKPDRITKIIDGCKHAGLEVETVNTLVDKDDLALIHGPHYLTYLRDKCADIHSSGQIMPSAFIRDTYTPLTTHTYQAALKSAGLALEGANRLLNGDDAVYALCRPPGHHAETDGMSGYCYINNAALAAHKLSQAGKKVAILDIDYHHGNGTQNIFYARNDVYYCSIHAEPQHAFPYATGFANETGVGQGEGYNLNLPIELEIGLEDYFATLNQAIQAVVAYKPDVVIVSLGYDAYENDPIGGLCLGEGDFQQIGYLLARELSYPTLLIQEGGYHIGKLAQLSESFLRGYVHKET